MCSKRLGCAIGFVNWATSLVISTGAHVHVRGKTCLSLYHCCSILGLTRRWHLTSVQRGTPKLLPRSTGFVIRRVPLGLSTLGVRTRIPHFSIMYKSQQVEIHLEDELQFVDYLVNYLTIFFRGVKFQLKDLDEINRAKTRARKVIGVDTKWYPSSKLGFGPCKY